MADIIYAIMNTASEFHSIHRVGDCDVVVDLSFRKQTCFCTTSIFLNASLKKCSTERRSRDESGVTPVVNGIRRSAIANDGTSRLHAHSSI